MNKAHQIKFTHFFKTLVWIKVIDTMSSTENLINIVVSNVIC